MTRLLAFGDAHVGAGVERYGAQRLDDQSLVIHRIADLAIEHGVDGVLFGGDAWERRKPSPAEMVAFAEPLQELKTAGIPVLAIPGNHCVSHPDQPVGLNVLALEGLVTLHREPGWTYLPGCYVATLPWTPVSRIVAQAGGGDRDDVNALAADYLLEVARGLYAEIEAQKSGGGPDRDAAVVLMLHWSLSGASLPSGLPIDMAREPIIDTAALEEIGFDFIVASHIHAPQTRDFQWRAPLPGDDDIALGSTVYTGSPLPLNHGEARTAHGCWLLDTEKGLTFLPIESRAFVTLDYTPEAWQEIVAGEPVAPPEGCIARARYTATAEQARAIDNTEIRRALLDAGASHVVVEPTIVRETTARVAGLDARLDERDVFATYLAAQTDLDDATRAELQQRFGVALAEVSS